MPDPTERRRTLLLALGVTRVAMGVPLFAVGIWLSWLILRTRQHA